MKKFKIPLLAASMLLAATITISCSVSEDDNDLSPLPNVRSEASPGDEKSVVGDDQLSLGGYSDALPAPEPGNDKPGCVTDAYSDLPKPGCAIGIDPVLVDPVPIDPVPEPNPPYVKKPFPDELYCEYYGEIKVLGLKCIGENGNWFVEGVDSGEKAEVSSGGGTPEPVKPPYEKPDDNQPYVKQPFPDKLYCKYYEGTKMLVRECIGENGNWFFDGVDSGKEAF